MVMERSTTFGIILCLSSYISMEFLDALSTRRLRNTSSLRVRRVLLWSIGVANIMQTMFGTLLLFLSSFTDGLKPGIRCNTDGFTTSAMTFVIINIITIMVVTYCNKHRMKYVEENLKTVIGVCWGFPLLISAFPFLGIGKYVPHGNGSFCCLDWTSRKPNDLLYFYTLLVVAFAMPCSFIVGSKIQEKKQIGCNEDDADEKEKGRSIRNKDTDSTFCIAMIFMLLWVPYGITTLYTLLGYSPSHEGENIALVSGLLSFVVLPFFMTRTLLPKPERPGVNSFNKMFRLLKISLQFLLLL